MTNAEFKEVLEELKRAVREDLVGTHIPNKERRNEVSKSLEFFKEIIDCDKIEWKIDEPFVGSADIMISGKEIHIKDPKLFGELLKISDVSEIVPMTNGILQFNITYYGTSGKVGG